MTIASDPRPHGSPWLLADGHARTGAFWLLHIGFGLVMGYGIGFIWWVRTGDERGFINSSYAPQFAIYHTLIAAAMHFLVWRRSHQVWRIVLGTLTCMVGFIVLRWAGDQWLRPWLGLRANYTPDITFGSFALDNILYALLPIGFGTLVHLGDRHRMHRLQRAELAYRERASELDLLHARMAPHFLFNTLNSLYALSQRPGTDLGPAIMDLADLMRYIAKHQERTVQLGLEVEQVQRYVALQRLRYDRPVHVRIDVPQEARSAQIPSMLLLPMMENAFKHGDPCDPGSPIILEAHVQGPRLTLRCTNRMGHGVDDGSPHTGNAHLRRRIELLYGPLGQVRAGERDGLHTTEVILPIAS